MSSLFTPKPLAVSIKWQDDVVHLDQRHRLPLRQVLRQYQHHPQPPQAFFYTLQQLARAS